MAKVRKEYLEKWFDDPAAELLNFLNSRQAIMRIAFERGRVIELSQRDAAQILLDEFGVEPPRRDE